MRRGDRHTVRRRQRANQPPLPRPLKFRSRALRFEPLEVRWLLAADFGDAPSPYPTLLSSNGPRHEAVGPMIGALRDADLDGMPSTMAEGDDLSATSDDGEGILFGLVQPGQLGATVTVQVQDAPLGAKLDAWVDFNRDGNWGGAGEHIFEAVSVVNGGNLLTFDVPSEAVAGTTFARFRLSSVGHLGIRGGATNGEVADVSVTIIDPVAGGLFARARRINQGSDPVSFVSAADLDGDEDMDVVSASPNSYLQWHENVGGDSFPVHTISSSAGTLTSVIAADVDGDGDMDLATSSASADRLMWWENNGSQSFTARSLPATADGAQGVFAADIDGDGDLDLLSASAGDDEIAWFENNGNQVFASRLISTSATDAASVYAADVDSDGDMDVLSAANNRISWYENNGSQTFVARTISTSVVSARRVLAIDMDLDGDMDVVSASIGDKKIAWYENNGAEVFTAHVVTSAANGVIDVFAADVDGDGDSDLLAASIVDHRIAWYENNGSQTFVPRILTVEAREASAVTVADMDDDGDLDVLYASQFDRAIAYVAGLADVDFGDAPVPYPTTLAKLGAGHGAVGPTLGASRQSDSDGVHSPTAGGDADDDGVQLGSYRVGQLDAALEVVVANAPAGARIDAWIDFNRDGNWGGADEQILKSASVVNGPNQLFFDVPSAATAGTTYARVRVSTAGGVGITELAVDGEVEDYQLTLVPPVAARGIYTGANVIATTSAGSRALYLADLDRDGDLDILSGNPDTAEVVWYEQSGNLQYTSHVVANGVSAVLEVVASDFDNDGDVDVAWTGTNGTFWAENDGSQSFTTLSINSSQLQGLSLGDVNGDGYTDLVVANVDGSWLVNNRRGGFEARGFADVKGDSVRRPHAADIDQDGDLDVVAALHESDSIAWYENDGKLNFTAHVVSLSADGATSAYAADFDGDGDVDLASSSETDGKIVWYENDGNQMFTPHVLSNALAGAQSVRAADIDGDGDVDVLVPSRMAGELAWFENVGGGSFVARILATGVRDVWNLATGDMDGDGDLDLLSTSLGLGYHNLAWYANLRQLDFGDAPAPFPTTANELGAVHEAVGPRLGSLRSSEFDGIHSPDSSASVDDDGVAFGMLRAGQLHVGITVHVENAPDGARLDAWIDFNGDSAFDGASERILASAPVQNGANELHFEIPSSAKSGTAQARFRLSSDGGLGIAAGAADGEVEDYQVTISPPQAAAGVFAGPHLLAASEDLSEIAAADMDGDGDLDFVSASSSHDRVAWYEDEGNHQFVGHTLTSSFAGVNKVLTADLDSDGDMDILATSMTANVLMWFENQGASFEAHSVTTFGYSVREARVADMDGDGDTDIVAASTAFGRIQWLENVGQEKFLEHKLVDNADAATGLDLADVDWDGDLDVVVSSYSNSTFTGSLIWYENSSTIPLTRHEIDISAPAEFRDVKAIDIDRDGDVDVLTKVGATIRWYDNDGSQNFVPRTIGDSNYSALIVGPADMDGDGDTDVVVALNDFSDSTIVWYENDGNQNFAPRTVFGEVMIVSGIATGDMDHDGDLDLAAALSSDEVVWLENLAPADFGDAPAPYATALRDRGAGHQSVGPRLGASRASQRDGAPSVGADGDADDDGVEFGSLRAGQLGATVVVDVQDAPSGARLDAWIDFNGDGSWSGPQEQIFSSRMVVAGDNLLTFDVPSWARRGTAYARFRLSTAGGLGLELVALDGEVEDHALAIDAPVSAVGIFSGPQVIDGAAEGAESVFAVDLDRDGDMDVLSASVSDDTIAWHENDGLESFTSHVITSAANGAADVVAADLDGDGDLDVLSASFDDGRINWYENDGTQGFIPHTISSSVDGATEIVVADLDRDGDMDVVAVAAADDQIIWFENDGAENFAAHLVASSTDGIRDLFVADVNRDGNLDLLSASIFDDQVAWYENSGTQGFSPRSLSLAEDGAAGVFAADIDEDGDMDVAAVGDGSFGGASWFENVGGEVFVRHSVDTSLKGNAIFASDLDGDGDVDLAVSGQNEIRWYENDGEEDFTRRYVAVPAFGPRGMVLADIDTDERLDVVAASSSADRVAWYKNLNFTPPTGDYDRNGSVDDADYLVWRSEFGFTGTGLRADGNGDHLVDAADFTIWRDYLGRTSEEAAGTGSAAVDTDSVEVTMGSAEVAVSLPAVSTSVDDRPPRSESSLAASNATTAIPRDFNAQPGNLRRQLQSVAAPALRPVRAPRDWALLAWRKANFDAPRHGRPSPDGDPLHPLETGQSTTESLKACDAAFESLELVGSRNGRRSK